ncbi:cation-independent mannose-6-phosphate receptor-like isoform X3 [Eurytemora carolleeae]|uniref:cation-independent mannose-6-phosphate receptor-like isoform X3 n=1 Tax=Eurytemora carolleeae TaxID=1294199 RepID=UPI000C77C013|nr:cation-independent mannose-6-phosphate receptor-like isoform X3 [Eurytemora carolleeae]|eukprot:XP_023345751.1 cation-independent mannose-6-phosphate receptor-like isoform X3 [Eurytemora affinis]
MDRDGNEFLLNVCGPLVVTDVPRSGCNPQGVCGYYNGDYVGMGKVLSSPRVVANGHIELRYEEGDICDGSGGTWSSTIYFTCAEIIDPKAPFGNPRLVSMDSTNCEAVFKVATILACANTSREMDIHEPDSCKIYHPGRQKYVDLSNLEKPGKYIVQDPTSQQVKYEIQPCGSVVSSCGGSVCKVEGMNNYSLGKMNDVKYFPESEELRVRYLEGDLCGIENKRFMTKIYYSCDPSAGVGSPSLDKNGKLACMIILNWRTIELCTKEEIDRYRQGGKVVDVDIKDTTTVKELVPPNTGMSWGHIIIVLMMVVGIAGGVYIYRTPGARERGNRTLQELRARLPVVLGGRSRNDSTLLVSSPGALFSDEDEYS